METVKKLTDAIVAALEASKNLAKVEAELSKQSAAIILGDEQFKSLKNAEQREAYLRLKLEAAYDAVDKAKTAMKEAAAAKEIAEAEFKAEKYQILLRVGKLVD